MTCSRELEEIEKRYDDVKNKTSDVAPVNTEILNQNSITVNIDFLKNSRNNQTVE